MSVRLSGAVVSSLIDCKDAEWLEAEALLRSAQKLPAGLQRAEALRLAGVQRWNASRRLFEAERTARRIADTELVDRADHA